MTLSMELVVELLRERGTKLDISDIGFILTVLRDNSEDDVVHEKLGDFLSGLRI